MYTMRQVRRIVTVLTSLAMLQLSVLGSALACSSMEGADRMAAASHHAAGQVHDSTDPQAEHDPPANADRRGDCLSRACTTPIALPVLEVALDPVVSSSRSDLGAVRAPDSLIQILDPPPPRG